MRILRSRLLWLAAIAAVAAVAVVLLSSSDGDEDGSATSIDDAAPPPEVAGQSARDEESTQPQPSEAGPDQETEVERVVRAYIAGIDTRDGAQVCGRLAPGAIQGFQLPRERGGCAASLGASIGYRDPRGFPVFGNARLDAIGDVTVGAGDARVTATVVTEFADRDQPSIEEDVIYLVESGGEWLVAKPSSTLYRAVGKPNVPPEAIAPPG